MSCTFWIQSLRGKILKYALTSKETSFCKVTHIWQFLVDLGLCIFPCQASCLFILWFLWSFTLNQVGQSAQERRFEANQHTSFATIFLRIFQVLDKAEININAGFLCYIKFLIQLMTKITSINMIITYLY